jgi:hypothetical protein
VGAALWPDRNNSSSTVHLMKLVDVQQWTASTGTLVSSQHSYIKSRHLISGLCCAKWHVHPPSLGSGPSWVTGRILPRGRWQLDAGRTSASWAMYYSTWSRLVSGCGRSDSKVPTCECCTDSESTRIWLIAGLVVVVLVASLTKSDVPDLVV